MGIRKIEPETVRELAKQGFNDKEIAQQLGVVRTTVKKCRDGNNIVPGTKVASRLLRAEIGKMLANGMSNAEMVKQTGLSESTVSRYRSSFQAPKKSLQKKSTPVRKPVARRIDP